MLFRPSSTLRRMSSLLLLAALLLSACAPVASPAPAAEAPAAEAPAEGAAAVTQDGPVVIYTVVAGGKDPEEEVLFMDEVERLSGIEVNMIKPPGSEYSQKLAAALAGGEQVDLMYMTTGLFESLFPQGLFAPVTDRIEASPVLSDPNIIDPAEWERVRRDDGEIYGVFNKDEGGTLPSVRCDWMRTLNLEPPTDLDGYYEMFRAFTQDDPDGNGQDDTYGLTLAGIYDIQPFMGVYGLAGRHVQNEDGTWSIPYATDAAIPVWEWLHTLYADGLLDPNFATNNTAAAREMIFGDRAGTMVYWAAWVGLFNAQASAEDPNTEFEMCGIEPPKGEDGQALLMAGEDGMWVLLANAKNPDAAFAFTEFWHTEPGNILSTLGIEGHDYTVENGAYTLTQVGEEHAMDHGAPYPKSLAWENPIGAPKGWFEANQIVKQYAKPWVSRADTDAAWKIVEQYGTQAILGEISAADAVAKMQEELRAGGHID